MSKRIVAILGMVLVLLTSFVFAEVIPTEVTLNREIRIMYNGNYQKFKNANGEEVFPISYNGTTYLPIRSISSLLKIGIRWDGEKNSIYLGEGEVDATASEVVTEANALEVEKINAKLNKEIVIYYRQEAQKFTDANGVEVFPISYNGTTYLPIRAISNLIEMAIEWDGEAKTITIKNNPYKNLEPDEANEEIERLRNLLEEAPYVLDFPVETDLSKVTTKESLIQDILRIEKNLKTNNEEEEIEKLKSLIEVAPYAGSLPYGMDLSTSITRESLVQDILQIKKNVKTNNDEEEIEKLRNLIEEAPRTESVPFSANDIYAITKESLLQDILLIKKNVKTNNDEEEIVKLKNLVEEAPAVADLPYGTDTSKVITKESLQREITALEELKNN